MVFNNFIYLNKSVLDTVEIAHGLQSLTSNPDAPRLQLLSALFQLLVDCLTSIPDLGRVLVELLTIRLTRGPLVRHGDGADGDGHDPQPNQVILQSLPEHV
jgi:hypothetical protein